MWLTRCICAGRQPWLLPLVLAAASCVVIAATALAFRGERHMLETALVSRVDAELEDIAGMLRTYRRTHGEYPSTEEGLRAIDVYAARYPTTGEHWEALGDLFRYSRRIKRALGGRLPRNPGEMWEAITVPERRALPAKGFELAVSRDYGVHLLYQGEILSPFNVPYVYIGAPGPIDDRGGRGCVIIENRVAVVCPETQQVWRRDVRPVWYIVRVGAILSIVLVPVTLAVVIIVGRRQQWKNLGIWALGFVALAIMIPVDIIALRTDGVGRLSPAIALRLDAVGKYAAKVTELYKEGRLSEKEWKRRLAYRIPGVTPETGQSN